MGCTDLVTVQGKQKGLMCLFELFVGLADKSSCWLVNAGLPTVTYSNSSQTCKMELFAKIINGCQPLTCISESFILDVLLGSKWGYASNS